MGTRARKRAGLQRGWWTVTSTRGKGGEGSICTGGPSSLGGIAKSPPPSVGRNIPPPRGGGARACGGPPGPPCGGGPGPGCPRIIIGPLIPIIGIPPGCQNCPSGPRNPIGGPPMKPPPGGIILGGPPIAICIGGARNVDVPLAGPGCMGPGWPTIEIFDFSRYSSRSARCFAQ